MAAVSSSLCQCTTATGKLKKIDFGGDLFTIDAVYGKGRYDWVSIARPAFSQ